MKRDMSGISEAPREEGLIRVTMTTITMTGTHNTMSYLPPRHWYGWLMLPFARCQSLTLRQQIDRGIRVFDLRVYLDGHIWRFAHGLCSFGKTETLHEVLRELPAHSIVRLILERGNADSEFAELCAGLESLSDLTFIGGRRKRGWKLLYPFKANERYDRQIWQWVGSMATDARWYERIIPWLYARRKRSTMPCRPGINLYDFV